MANKDIEVEIKVPLDKNNISDIKEKLGSIAKFIGITKQKDEYFVPVHRDFMEPNYPFEWLSIRERGDKIILNYKHWYPENNKENTHCDEYETVIENSDQLRKLFLALDFKNIIIVDKERSTYNYKDEFEIALDYVKWLGYFIEVEAMKDFGGVEKTRGRLFEFAKSLGLDISKKDEKGYPYLLMEKKGLIKK